MSEAGLVVVAILALVGLALVPATWGLVGGIGLTTVSLLVGTVAGVGYHVVLARSLGTPLPRGFWWRPTNFHKDVPEDRRRRFMGWFYVGAAGFVGCLLGLAITVTGLVKSL